MKNKIINKYQENKRDYNIIITVEAIIVFVTLMNIF